MLAHAEGGGVLYVDAAADPGKTPQLVEASLDRLGVCNRLNLLLVHRDAVGGLPAVLAVLERLGIRGYGTERAREHSLALPPLDHRRSGTNGRTTPERSRRSPSTSSQTSPRRVRSRTRRCPALAAGIVTEERRSADAFLASYRGTTAFWHAPTRFTDGFALTGAPETGINVEPRPGPRGPVTYRDLWLRQLRVVGDGTQHS